MSSCTYGTTNDHSFPRHTSLESPNETLYLNSMRYHGASIENIYYYRLPSIVTQFIGNDQLTISLIGRSHY